MQRSRNRSRSPDDYSKRSLLSKVDKREFQKLRVAIKRSGIGRDGPELPLERDIEDFKQISLLVHVRRGAPPRVPIFSGDIKVNQDFCEDRTVFTHNRRSKSASRYRSRSRSCNASKRSKSRDRYKRRSKDRDRSRSRSRSSRGSKSRDRKRYRDASREKSRRSRSRSRSSKRPYERKRRSITPLRPGEYRPGHPDLALRKQRKKSRSRSRSRSPRFSASRERSTMPVPVMEYDFYEGYGQFGPMAPMAPYRGVPPGFYPHPRMYPPQMMMPRMPMAHYPPPQMFRQRLPVYNSRKIATPITVTVTSQEKEKERAGVVVAQPCDEPERGDSMEISSSNRKCESDTGASDIVTV